MGIYILQHFKVISPWGWNSANIRWNFWRRKFVRWSWMMKLFKRMKSRMKIRTSMMMASDTPLPKEILGPTKNVYLLQFSQYLKNCSFMLWANIFYTRGPQLHLARGQKHIKWWWAIDWRQSWKTEFTVKLQTNIFLVEIEQKHLIKTIVRLDN